MKANKHEHENISDTVHLRLLTSFYFNVVTIIDK